MDHPPPRSHSARYDYDKVINDLTDSAEAEPDLRRRFFLLMRIKRFRAEQHCLEQREKEERSP